MASRDVDVRVTTNASRFASQVRQADRALVGLGRASRTASSQMSSIEGRMRSIEGASRRAQQALGAFLSVQAVRQVGRFAQRITEASRNLVAQADSLGVASDRLEAFTRVMEDSGATVRQVTSGLSRLARNIGLAAEGGGPAVDLFRRLGIAVRDSNNNTRDAISVYRDLVRSLEGVSASARSAAIAIAAGDEANRIFGANAAQGAAALETALAGASRRGLASDEQNRQLADLNNSFRAFRETVESLVRIVFANFSQDLGRLILQARETATALIQIEQTSGAVSRAISETANQVRAFFGAFQLLVLEILASFFVFGRLTRVISGFGRSILQLGVRSNRFNRSLVEISRRVPGIRLLGSAFIRIGRALNRTASILRGPLGQIFGVAGVFAGLRDLRNRLLGILDPLRRLREELGRFDQVGFVANNAFEELNRTFANVSEINPRVAERFRDEVLRTLRGFQFLTSENLQIDDETFRVLFEQTVNRMEELTRILNREAYNAGEEVARSLFRGVQRGLAVQNPFTTLEVPFTEQLGLFNQQELRQSSRDLARTQAEVARQAIRLNNLLGDGGFLARLQADSSLAEDAVGRVESRLAQLVSTGQLTQEMADDLRRSFGLLEESTNRLADFAGNAAAIFSDWLADSIFRVNSLRDALTRLAEAISRIAINVFIGQPLAEFFQGIAGRQFGGPVQRGRPYRVGESGPETIIPIASGYVVPNNASGAPSVSIDRLIVQGVEDPHVVAAGVRNILRRDWIQDINASQGGQ